MRNDIKILMTAWKRPQYLRRVLQSWYRVRGIEDIELVIFLEPSDRQAAMIKVIREFQELTDITTRHFVAVGGRAFFYRRMPLRQTIEVAYHSPYFSRNCINNNGFSHFLTGGSMGPYHTKHH
jgi:hypothetical protein